MVIRESTESDKAAIGSVHRTAFGEAKGPEIADLVKGLLEDTTAVPLLSLVAVEGNKIVGHVLYTKVEVTEAAEQVAARILAPLAVLPEVQSRDVGGQLIQVGIRLLRQAGVELVFVLGHPGYYPRFGFTAAGELGFVAPYPIPAEHAGAWMVQELRPGVVGRVAGKIQCADVLNQPEHWRE